jgi:Tol biopolymer transport system component
MVSAETANRGGGGESLNPSLSGDGRYIVFESSGSDLVAGDSNGQGDVFLADLCNGAVQCMPSVTRISSDSTVEADGASYSPVLSADGQVVAFASAARNLVGNDSNFVADVFMTRWVKSLP